MEEKYVSVELRMKDLETGNLNLEAKLQESSGIILVKDSLLR